MHPNEDIKKLKTRKIGANLDNCFLRSSNDDVVDWDEYELDEEPDESHHHKSNRRTHSNFGEF